MLRVKYVFNCENVLGNQVRKKIKYIFDIVTKNQY